jgi:hypothetical protein
LRDTLFRDIRGLPAALLDARGAIQAELAASIQAEEATVTSVMADAIPVETAQMTLFEER